MTVVELPKHDYDDEVWINDNDVTPGDTDARVHRFNLCPRRTGCPLRANMVRCDLIQRIGMSHFVTFMILAFMCSRVLRSCIQVFTIH